MRPTSEQISEIIANAVAFEYSSPIGELMGIGKTYDMVSFVTIEDKRYGVIHSIFVDPSNFPSIMKRPIILSESTTTYKRDCIKQYLRTNGCNDRLVYCVVQESSYNEDF